MNDSHNNFQGSARTQQQVSQTLSKNRSPQPLNRANRAKYTMVSTDRKPNLTQQQRTIDHTSTAHALESLSAGTGFSHILPPNLL